MGSPTKLSCAKHIEREAEPFFATHGRTSSKWTPHRSGYGLEHSRKGECVLFSFSLACATSCCGSSKAEGRLPPLFTSEPNTICVILPPPAPKTEGLMYFLETRQVCTTEMADDTPLHDTANAKILHCKIVGQHASKCYKCDRSRAKHTGKPFPTLGRNFDSSRLRFQHIK